MSAHEDEGKTSRQLDAFLATTKARFIEAISSNASIHIVLGNEAADLDSMVCAIAVSLLRSTESDASSKDLYVPVVNIPAQDFVLRGECVYLFGLLGIDVTAHLVFWDQFDFASLAKENNRLRLVLVDHNHLSAAQEQIFSKSVVEIIDHHVDEKLYLETTQERRNIELIGSCSSLVTEEIIKSDRRREILTQDVAKLLAATILVDTVNFNPEAKKGTPKDRKLLDTLLNEYLNDSGNVGCWMVELLTD